MKSYNNVCVKKPWGFEYLAYENEDVGLWILHINKDQSTSMHCHPLKNTGLVLLDGNAQISFLNDSHTVNKYDKMMIRKGLFHKTKAITDCVLLEIESPKDKEDLVRLEDNYGRESKEYENENFHTSRNENNLWLEVGKKYNFYQNNIEVKQINSHADYQQDFDLCIVLKGGFKIGNKNVLNSGDVVTNTTLNKLKKFEVEENTIFMLIKNEN